jgi:hypothetical protein
MKTLNVAGLLVIIVMVAYLVHETGVSGNGPDSHMILASTIQSVKLAVDPHAAVKWEHGWKTGRIVATRMKSQLMGENIKFEFPDNLYDSDRAEVSQFVEMNGGNVYEGGGSPGAPMYATFKGVKDTESADKKLVEILPKFDELMAHLDDKSYMKKFSVWYDAWDKANNPQWPDTTPPDKTDKYWELNNNLNVNGVQYLKKEVSPGKWQWVVDDDAMKSMADYEQKRWELFSAIGTRKLTHEELMGVDPLLGAQPMTPYFPCEKYAEIYDLLVKQWEFQTGNPMPFPVHLSVALGEYNRCPQEEDNKQAVEHLIEVLQKMTEPKTTVASVPKI